jgi:hypothetical protein
MELIHQDSFYKVYASKIGAYVTVWSSDYPTKDNLICTCDDMKDAQEMAELYVHCKNNGIDF